MTGKVHGIPFGVPFPVGFFSWFQRVFPQPLQQAQACVLVPTRRAVITLEEAARDKLQAALLPKFIALSDLAHENPFHLEGTSHLPPIISPLRRYVLLEKLVGAFLGKSQAFYVDHYVQSLCDVMDELLVHGVTLDQLSSWDPGPHGEHFEKTFQLLRLILEYWPKILQDEGLIEAQSHTQACFSMLNEYFEKSSPQTPVILAGSTGSLPMTRRLMQSILGLPQGYLVLPGADESIFHRLPLTHPQGGLADLVRFLEIQRRECSFHEVLSRSGSLLHGAFDDSGFVLPSHFPQEAFPEMVEVGTLLEEARVVALICRYHLEHEQNVTIICPDPALQTYVTQELARFQISPNTSLGEPLNRTVVGGFLCDLTALRQQFSPNNLFSVLKNPLCFKAHPEGRLVHLEKVRHLENTAPRSKAFTLSSLWPELLVILDSFLKKPSTVENLFQMAYALSCGELEPLIPFEKSPLFDQADGGALWDLYQALNAECLLGHPQESLEKFMNLTPPVRFYEGLGAPVKILGTLEARLVSDGVVILTSLNEGSWPKPVTPTCWIHTALRAHLKLPPLESFIGLAAHDFASCFHGHVYLTRARQSQGVTQEPSRFWQRMGAVAEKNGLRATSEKPWLFWSQQKYKADIPIKIRAPFPCPLVSQRPKHITISDVDLLVKDPYGFYAKTCLKLKPLGPLEGRTNDLMKRGIAVHDLLEWALENPEISIESEMDRLFSKYGLENPFLAQQFLRIVGWMRQDLKKRGNLQHFLEQAGEMTVFVDGQPIMIKGRADRMDKGAEHVSIIDYKTGTPPSVQDIMQGYAPQLPIEALMVYKKAFHENLSYVDFLEVWHMRGFEPVVNVKKIPMTSELLNQSRDGLLLLLKTFLCEPTPFLACPNPQKMPGFVEYNHLERLDEWQQWGIF